jgi:hypothetical protein
MGKLIQFQHPGNYSLIVIDGQYYRFSKDQPIPKEATFLEDDIMNMPGLWSHPRYNEKAKKVITKRGHDNP